VEILRKNDVEFQGGGRKKFTGTGRLLKVGEHCSTGNGKGWTKKTAGKGRKKKEKMGGATAIYICGGG